MRGCQLADSHLNSRFSVSPSRLVLTIAMLAGIAATAEPALAQNAPPPVTVAKPVVREVVDEDNFIGRFEAVDEVSIRARVGGYLQDILFQDGAVVTKGDILFVIDQRPFQTAYDEAKAALELAESTADYARTQFERAESLAKTGAQSVAVLDDRRRGWLSAQASVRGAKAALDRAALDLEYTRITAPISGRVDRKLVSVGSLIQADQTELTTIVSLDPIDFYFDVDERRLLNFAKTARSHGADLQLGGGGLKATVTIADSTAKPFIGVLDFAENRFDAGTGTMRVRARFQNRDGALYPGLFGRVAIEGSNRYEAVMLPDAAITSDQNQRVVYVVGEDGTVVSRPVRPGPRLYGYRVIREGLDGSETVVVNGLMRARPGSKVTPNMIELPDSYEVAPERAAAESGK
jgi:RND family efflux transporter MFP subunit